MSQDPSPKVPSSEPVEKRGRRPRFTLPQKQQMLEEAKQPGSSISEVARKYKVAPSQLFLWRRHAEAGELSGLAAAEPTVAESEVKRLKTQIKELERQLGRKSMQVEILTEAWEVMGIKKPLPPLR